MFCVGVSDDTCAGKIDAAPAVARHQGADIKGFAHGANTAAWPSLSFAQNARTPHWGQCPCGRRSLCVVLLSIKESSRCMDPCHPQWRHSQKPCERPRLRSGLPGYCTKVGSLASISRHHCRCCSAFKLCLTVNPPRFLLTLFLLLGLTSRDVILRHRLPEKLQAMAAPDEDLSILYGSALHRFLLLIFSPL